MFASRISETVLAELAVAFHQLFEPSASRYWDTFAAVFMQVIQPLRATNAPYHNANHTLQVLQVGQAIWQGKQAQGEPLMPSLWLDCMVALLCHDIGYCRGICHLDIPADNQFWTGRGSWTTLSPEQTDAALDPFHVARSQQFVRETLPAWELITPERILSYIAMTECPLPAAVTDPVIYSGGGFCRAADLIGQLSDRNYLQQLSALYCEFAETGLDQAMGYHSQAELQASYPASFWHEVYPYVQAYLPYLAKSQTGRHMVARLYTNAYLAESQQRSN